MEGKIDLNVYEFKNVHIMEKDGIVYVKNASGIYTIWLKDRPGIVGEVEKVEDGPAKIQEILDAIDGWED